MEWRSSGLAPILFPVIGLLRDDRYLFNGGHYKMPKHGFARHSLFAVVKRDLHAATLRLTASEASRAIYPFEFRLEGVHLIRQCLRAG